MTKHSIVGSMKIMPNGQGIYSSSTKRDAQLDQTIGCKMSIRSEPYQYINGHSNFKVSLDSPPGRCTDMRYPVPSGVDLWQLGGTRW